MNVPFLQQRSSERAISFAGIVGLHLLLYGLLLQLSPEQAGKQTGALPEDAANRSMVLWHLPAPTVNRASLPPPPRESKPPVTRPALQAVKLRPASPAPISEPAPLQVPSTPPVATANAAATPPVPRDGRDTSDIERESVLTGQTRRELARIAGQLRKESRFPPDFNVHAKPDKLAQGIAGAYRGGGVVTVTDIELADGRVMTKISGPQGSMCVYKDSVGRPGASDQLLNGVPTKTTTCPQ